MCDSRYPNTRRAGGVPGTCTFRYHVAGDRGTDAVVSDRSLDMEFTKLVQAVFSGVGTLEAHPAKKVAAKTGARIRIRKLLPVD